MAELIGMVMCIVVAGLLTGVVGYRIGKLNAAYDADQIKKEGEKQGWLNCEGFVLNRAAKESFALHAKITRWFQWPEDITGKGEVIDAINQ